MSSPYAPYRSLTELLAVADVAVADLGLYSTPQLLERAAKNANGPRKRVQPGRVPMATRSVCIPFALQQAVDEKARNARTNFNQVVTRLLEGYINGSS